MGVVKNLMVRAGADFSAITTQAKKVKASMGGMQSAVGKACSKMSAAADGMKKAFHALGAAVSVGAVTAFAKSAKEAYDVQAEGEAKLAQVMRNTIGASNDEIASIKELCSAQQALGIIGDEVQLAGAQELATYVTMTSTLKTLIPVMNDMSAQQYGLGATAESTANIATMLGKVMNGQTSALSRYGYTFDAAQESVLKYGTEAQRAAVLAEVVGQSVGGMNAALAATPSGRLKQVSNTLGDIKEGFGAAVSTVLTVFLPVLNTVCTVLASAATLANKVAQSIANVFGGGAKSAASAVSYTGAAVSAMDDLGSSAEAAGKAASSLGTYGFDTLQKLSGSSGGGSGGGVEAGAGETVGGTVAETIGGTEESSETVGLLEQVLTRLKETAGKLDFSNLSSALERLKTAVKPLTQELFSGLSWAYDNIFEPLAQWTVEDALPAFLDALAAGADACTEPLSRLGNALKPLASSAFEGLKWGYDNIFEPLAQWTVEDALPAFLDALATGAAACTEPLSGLGDALKPLASSAFEGLKWGYDNILIPLGTWVGSEALPAFLDLLSGACEFLSSVLDALKPMGQWLWDHFLEPIASWTGGVITTVLEDLSSLLEGLANVISENFSWASISEFFSNLSFGEGVLLAIGIVIVSVTAVVGALSAIIAIATAVATAFGIAVAILTNPITWVVAAIAALIGIVALLVKNWDKVKETAAAVWESIKGVWSAVSGWFDTHVVQPVAGFFSGLWDGVKNAASSVWEGIKGVWNAAGTWFADHVTTPISNGFRGFANGVIGFFEGLGNGAIDGVNAIIRALNKISFDIPDWVPVIGGKTFGFNLNPVAPLSLPRLANGAVFEGNDPYLAVVNDQKHGVNVETPLSTMIEAMMTALRSVDLLGDIQVDVRAVFNGQLAALARLLRPYFEADAKRVGGRASTSKGVI